jgi:hypothetical protein
VSASVLAVASLFYAEGSERLITRGDHPVRTGLIELDGQAWAAVGSDLGDGPVGRQVTGGNSPWSSRSLSESADCLLC